MTKSVYLAGPWFHEGQPERLEYVRTQLEDAGYSVYYPKDHPVSPDGDQDWRNKVFSSNVNAIQSSDFVLAITDGNDMGTNIEIGLAYASKVPLVLYAETLGDHQFNLMAAQAGKVVITSRNQLLDLLKKDSNTGKPVLDNYIEGTKKFEYDGKIE